MAPAKWISFYKKENIDLLDRYYHIWKNGDKYFMIKTEKDIRVKRYIVPNLIDLLPLISENA